MPVIFASADAISPPFSIPPIETNYQPNDSLWRKSIALSERISLLENTESSASFYGSPHLLSTRSVEPVQLAARPVYDWMIWILILSLGALSVSKLFYPHRSRQFLRATLGGRLFNQMERDGTLFNETPTWFLFGNFLIITSLLITQTLIQTNLHRVTDNISPLLLFAMTLGVLILFLPVKGLLTGFFAWVFKTQQANNAYTKNIFLFNNLAGVILLPFVVYNAYTPSELGLFLSWIILLLINLVKFFRGAAIGYSQAGFSVYYLILYLCAFELAPLLIFIKAASRFLMPG